MNRVLRSGIFWICICSIIILDFVLLYIVAGNIFIYKRGFINLFLLPKLFVTNIAGFFLPIIPFLFLFSKRNKLEINHMKDYWRAALCAPIMFAFAYLFELLLYYVIDSSIKNLAFPPTGLFSSILVENPLEYIFLYILHTSIWGFILTLLGLGIYHRTQNEFYAIVLAFLMSRLSEYIPIVFGNIRVPFLGYIIPRLPFEISQMEDNFFSNLSQIIFIIFISILLLKNKKQNKSMLSCKHDGLESGKQI